MTPEGSLVEEIKLANGLSLFIYDQSRPMIGDRWLVKLLIHISVPIKQEHLAHLPDPGSARAEFSEAMEGSVCLQQERIRNFIDSEEVPETLRTIKDEILAATLSYVSSAGFEERLVLKRYSEWLEAQKLVRARRNPSA